MPGERDMARNRFVDSPTQDYLIQVWPGLPSSWRGFPTHVRDLAMQRPPRVVRAAARLPGLSSPPTALRHRMP